jgi:hypothetical protein
MTTNDSHQAHLVLPMKTQTYANANAHTHAHAPDTYAHAYAHRQAQPHVLVAHPMSPSIRHKHRGVQAWHFHVSGPE